MSHDTYETMCDGPLDCELTLPLLVLYRDFNIPYAVIVAQEFGVVTNTLQALALVRRGNKSDEPYESYEAYCNRCQKDNESKIKGRPQGKDKQPLEEGTVEQAGHNVLARENQKAFRGQR